MTEEKGPPDLSREKGIRTILVIRLKALGDIALSLPIVRALKDGLPRSRIYYLCREPFAEALAGESSVDRIVVLPDGLFDQLRLLRSLRSMKPDMTLDLISSPRSAYISVFSGSRIRIGMDVGRHRWCYTHLVPRIIVVSGERIKRYTFDSNLEIVRMLGLPAGIDGSDGSSASGGVDRYAIGFPAAETEREWARRYVSELGQGDRRLVGVVPAATNQSKSWPQAHFVELMKMMIERYDLVPIILWGPGEEETARAVAAEVPRAILAPPTGIARLGALIKNLDLLVTTDSGPKHLAVLLGVATVTLFGPTDPEIWDPMNALHRVLHRESSCSPCRKKECKPNSCLSDILPDAVLHEIGDLLGEPVSEPEDSR